MQMWEIALAAPEVVAHRTARMARWGPTPRTADRKEFTRMTQEKFEAIGESASAMAAEIVRANLALWPSVLRCAGGTLPSAMWMPTALAGSRRFASKSALAAGAVPRIVSSDASRVLAKGLAPVHRRATANAKRLRQTPR